MEIKHTSSLSPEENAHVNQLWNEEYPVTLIDRFPLLLNDTTFSDHFVIFVDQKLVGWTVIFTKDGEKRFSILVDSNHQGKGIGTRLIELLFTHYDDFYGWVIDKDYFLKKDGSRYLSPLPFYQKLNFKVLPDQRIDTDMLSAVKIHFKS